jgi:two-component system chemotaxis sensor kinase CheA
MARGLEAGGAGLLAIRYLPDAHCFFRGEDPLGLMRQLPGLRALLLDPVEPWAVLAEIDPFQCNMCLRAIVEAPRAEVEQWLRYALDQVEIVALPQGERVAAVCGPIASQPGVSQSPLPAPATLRVEQAKIDVLMNLIGELVVAKNAIAYLARCAEQGQLSTGELAREIKARHALVNRIAEDMQGAVMSVRMLPVEQIFQRFPRLVRDVSRRLGKRVELVVEGGDTEADKNIIEAIADPLIHMVRNSLDHGIETPEVRRQAGKPEHGTLRLTAVQDNDEVFIGIDPAAVRRRAMEQGLIDGERARAMSDEDAIALVFAPGFSTAPEVSDLSGRGVGMDVVRAAVEKVGGRVSIASRIGVGTTVELVLPLSLAVTRIMTVCCGDGLFGVPMSLVVETVRVARAALHRFRDREAFVLRDRVVPVLRLAALLGLPDDADAGEEVAILVVQIRGERLGLVVGAFREGMEAIVKPMEGVLADVQGFSGTTLLGDGRVLLVLDLRELVA